MASQKQVEANRVNAKLSTGPKSETGRAIASQNSKRHGLFSRQILLEGESKKEFELLQIEFYQQCMPQGFLEELFCERALTAAWRLSRVTQMETMLIDHTAKRSFGHYNITDVLGGYQGDELSLLSRYETALEKILFRSLTELRALQNMRMASLAEVKIGFVPQKIAEELIETDCNAL